MKSKKSLAIARELRRIAKQNGGLLLPQSVVEAARPQNSPLHSRFEWDDTEAAESYRLWQARQLIRVVVEQIAGVAAPTEVFVSLSPDRSRGHGYRVTTEVMSDAAMRGILLQDALDELNVFRHKYARLRELAIVFSAIRKVKRKK
jgi:hypothetical protein